MIKEAGGEMAFSTPAIFFGIFALIIGFIFYCVLAGPFASPVSKLADFGNGL